MNRQKLEREALLTVRHQLRHYGAVLQKVRRTGSNHLSIQFEHGGRRRTFVVAGSGDWTAIPNIRARIRAMLEGRL